MHPVAVIRAVSRTTLASVHTSEAPMQRVDAEWPPRVGDLVYVIETGDLGEVMGIEGSGNDLQVVIDLYPQVGGSKNPPFDLAEADRGAQRRYTLAELMQQP
jgi:hypothetical protein